MKAKIAEMSKSAETPRRLQTMPGVGPITALAVETFAPPMEQFRRGRDFAAWLGLVPRQHSTGGKQQAGEDLQDGPARYQALADHRGDGGDPMGITPRFAEQLLAVAAAGAQAADGGGGRAGEQDGAGHLGDADARRRLSRPEDDRRLIRRRRYRSDPKL